jgi:mandelate racemase
MKLPQLTVQDVRARAVVAPLVRPVRTALGTIPSAPLVLIDVMTKEGVVGTAYIFAYTPLALPALHRLVLDIGREIVGMAGVPVEIMRYFDRRFRLLGWQGLVGMAISGIDMALWDALGRASGEAVASLLGGAPRAIEAYDSYGVVDPELDEAVLRASIASGFRAIKIKVGDGDLGRDVNSVGAVRNILGPHVKLMVDFNQSLDITEAIRRIEALEPFDLHWVEEPVRAEDHRGHAAVRSAVRAPIQTGENWWHLADMSASIAARASAHAMPDLMKIGGITGWMAAAELAEQTALPVSSHLFVEASAHAMAVTPTAHLLEWLDIAGGVSAETNKPVDGKVTATGPGLGIVWDEAAVRRYAA